jgi:hypothetical protein
MSLDCTFDQLTLLFKLLIYVPIKKKHLSYAIRNFIVLKNNSFFDLAQNRERVPQLECLQIRGNFFVILTNTISFRTVTSHK